MKNLDPRKTPRMIPAVIFCIGGSLGVLSVHQLGSEFGSFFPAVLAIILGGVPAILFPPAYLLPAASEGETNPSDYLLALSTAYWVATFFWNGLLALILFYILRPFFRPSQPGEKPNYDY